MFSKSNIHVHLPPSTTTVTCTIRINPLVYTSHSIWCMYSTPHGSYAVLQVVNCFKIYLHTFKIIIPSRSTNKQNYSESSSVSRYFDILFLIVYYVIQSQPRYIDSKCFTFNLNKLQIHCLSHISTIYLQ